MKKTIKMLCLTALLLFIAGAMLTGAAVANGGWEQAVKWLGMPMYITHSDEGWEISTLNYYDEPLARTWEGDADDVTRLRLDVVDADFELRAVEGADTVKLSWYERYENEYAVSLENGALELAHEERVGFISFDVSSVWEDAVDVPAFVLEYPADQEWLAVVLTGVSAEIETDERLTTEQISVDLVDCRFSMPVTAGRFSLDAVDAAVTAELDCGIIDLDLVDVDAELTLAGSPEDYRFDLEHTDAAFSLNGESYVDEEEMSGDWELGSGTREVKISGVDAEVNVFTGLR